MLHDAYPDDFVTFPCNLKIMCLIFLLILRLTYIFLSFFNLEWGWCLGLHWLLCQYNSRFLGYFLLVFAGTRWVTIRVFAGNVLLLKNNLDLSPDTVEVSQEKLLSLVAGRLIDSNSNLKVISLFLSH